jgi:VWFA-related protein
LDTSGSTFAELSKIRRAAKEFIDRLRAGDKVALIAFSASNTGRSSDTFSIILSPLTSDRSELYQALERLTTSYGTPYYDSLLKVTEEVFNKPAERQFKGRRALVAMTDGVDSTSKSDFDLASEQILRAGLSVYFLRIDSRDYFEENLLGDCTVAKHFSDSQLKRFYDSFGKGSRIERKTNFCQLGDFERLEISKRLYEIADNEMERLAAASGGKVFEAGTDSEVLRAFGQIAQEIGSRYAIGYYSNNTAQDGSYRKIIVKGKNLPAGAIIRAREGYIAPKSQ